MTFPWTKKDTPNSKNYDTWKFSRSSFRCSSSPSSSTPSIQQISETLPNAYKIPNSNAIPSNSKIIRSNRPKFQKKIKFVRFISLWSYRWKTILTSIYWGFRCAKRRRWITCPSTAIHTCNGPIWIRCPSSTQARPRIWSIASRISASCPSQLGRRFRASSLLSSSSPPGNSQCFSLFPANDSPEKPLCFPAFPSLSLSLYEYECQDRWFLNVCIGVCVYIYIEVLLILGLQSSRQRKACDRKKQMLVVGITCKGGAIENVRYPRATSSLVRYFFFFNNGIIKLTTWQIFYLQGMREQAFVISSCIFGQIIWGNSCVGTGLDWPEKSHGKRPKDFNRSIFFL